MDLLYNYKGNKKKATDTKFDKKGNIVVGKPLRLTKKQQAEELKAQKEAKEAKDALDAHQAAVQVP